MYVTFQFFFTLGKLAEKSRIKYLNRPHLLILRQQACLLRHQFLLELLYRVHLALDVLFDHFVVVFVAEDGDEAFAFGVILTVVEIFNSFLLLLHKFSNSLLIKRALFLKALFFINLSKPVFEILVQFITMLADHFLVVGYYAAEVVHGVLSAAVVYGPYVVLLV